MIRVQVGKIDLDTAGAACLLGVTREWQVEVLRNGQATEADLANPNILCIEVGGSGRVAKGDYDHHGPGAPDGMLSATAQAFTVAYDGEMLNAAARIGNPSCVTGFHCWWRCDCTEECFANLTEEATQACKLADYIHRLDVHGPSALGPRQEGVSPTLSDVFAGMLLVTRDPVEQLHRGVAILREVLARDINPFGRMPTEEVPGWVTYAEAKTDNNRQIAKAVESAQWETAQSGLRLAVLETDFFGAPGALYGAGAQVVVAYSPHFGPARVPKFTVAGNDVKVNAVLAELNAREPGWGGPPTGTIVGSPREGSSLTLTEVTEIVRRVL